MKTLFHCLTIISFLLISFYSFAQNNDRFDEEIFKLNVTAIAKKVLRDIDTICSLNPNRLRYKQQTLLNRNDLSNRIVVFEIIADTAKLCCEELVRGFNSSCYLILVVTNPTKSLSEGFMYEYHYFYANFEQFIDIGSDDTIEILVGLWGSTGIDATYEQYIISIQNKKSICLTTFDNTSYFITYYSKKGDVMGENYANFKVWNDKLYVFLSQSILASKNEETLEGTYQENLYLITYQYDKQKKQLLKVKQDLIGTILKKD